MKNRALTRGEAESCLGQRGEAGEGVGGYRHYQYQLGAVLDKRYLIRLGLFTG